MKTVRVHGATLAGAAAELVTVEARFEAVDRDRTEVVLTGLPDPVIRESRGRLVSALKESGLRLPSGRLHLNLVPAGRRKAGEMLDLALALGAAAASGHLAAGALDGRLYIGEVGIDGSLHAVPGGLAAAEAAREAGLPALVAPPATAREAACLSGVRVFAARNLSEVLALASGAPGAPGPVLPVFDGAGPLAPGTSLDRVRGQAAGKRALALAATGGHGLLFRGPPGTGKSLLARCLVELLPPPSLNERLDITRVLSVVGRWPGGLARGRPFRAPHHTTSYAGLVGGGAPPVPGEITLAHRGVLFLDELPEFRREALEALRQPLEEGSVSIARAGRALELPARFQLVCAMNPCPCGYRGHPRIPCRCPESAVLRYTRRVSGPLLDRIDLRVELPAATVDELARADAEPELRALALRDLVLAARRAAEERQGPLANAALDADALDRVSPLRGAVRALLDSAAARLGLSARAVQSLRRVARSAADLAGAERVAPEHVAEALALRVS